MRLPVVDVIAGHEHFRDHTVPVWKAMPPEMRGGYFTKRSLDPGLRDEPYNYERAGHGDLTLVCSYGDLFSATAQDEFHRPVVFMEHGAGFTFEGSDGRTLSSYSGSLDRPNVALFLNPNDYVTQQNARAHPDTPQVVIGSPKMDRWYHGLPTTPFQRGETDRPTVAIALHWDCIIAPGTRSAYAHYRGWFGSLLDKGWNVVATAHPRFKLQMEMECLSAGIPFVNSLTYLFEKADVMIADATSAMYEFASLDRPVLVLNAPWYQEEKDDGIRFWKHIPGLQIDDPSILADATRMVLDDKAPLPTLRYNAIEAVYPHRGDAAQRAVDAIIAFAKEYG